MRRCGGPVGNRMLLDQFASFAGVFLVVALIFELRAHVARQRAIAAAFAKPTWLARLFRARAFLLLRCAGAGGWRRRASVGAAVVVHSCEFITSRLSHFGFHCCGADPGDFVSVVCLGEAEKVGSTMIEWMT